MRNLLAILFARLASKLAFSKSSLSSFASSSALLFDSLVVLSGWTASTAHRDHGCLSWPYFKLIYFFSKSNLKVRDPLHHPSFAHLHICLSTTFRFHSDHLPLFNLTPFVLLSHLLSRSVWYSFNNSSGLAQNTHSLLHCPFCPFCLFHHFHHFHCPLVFFALKAQNGNHIQIQQLQVRKWRSKFDNHFGDQHTKHSKCARCDRHSSDRSVFATTRNQKLRPSAFHLFRHLLDGQHCTRGRTV